MAGQPGPDGVVHLHFPVEIEVLSAGDEAAGPLALHFPVEIQVVPSASAGDVDAITDRALARLATAMDSTWS